MKFEVENYKSKEKWLMESVNGGFVTSSVDLQRVTSICNQPEVHTLFPWLKDKEYTIEDAQKFITWSQEGWESDQYYVFLLRDVNGNISACVDIKKRQDSDHGSREIGYWADKEKSGIITNAVAMLEKFAKEKGILGLYGLVIPENTKSQQVLIRAGYQFAYDEFNDEKQKQYRRFEKKLQ